MPEKKAEIILKVAQAIGTKLDMPELLAALHDSLIPVIHFDAAAIVILSGEDVKIHSAHIEGLVRSKNENVEKALNRFAASIEVARPPMTLRVEDHPLSVIMNTGQP